MKSLSLLLFVVLAPAALAERPDRYFDPVDQRTHAAVALGFVEGRLVLSVSAVGPVVEAPRGFEGLAGTNLQTAFELSQLEAGEELAFTTRDDRGRVVSSGEIFPGARGRIPLRRLRADGRIDFHAESERSYLLGFTTAGRDALPAGAYRSELRARGETRLHIDYRIDAAGQGTVLAFTEAGHAEHPPVDATQRFRFVALEGGTGQAPVAEAYWSGRDLLAKWVLYRKSLDEGVESTAWVDFLVKQKDYLFLEYLAMHQVDAYQLHGIGAKLKKADAPNWLRLAAWMTSSNRGHVTMVTESLLMDMEKKDLIASWIRKHPNLAKGKLLVELAQLDKAKAGEADTSAYLPAFDAASVFRALDAPAELAELGGAKRIEANKVYLEQVLAAIDALVVSGLHESGPWALKLAALRGHAHDRVRQASWLAVTHFSPMKIPRQALGVVQNSDEDPRVREAALLAFSYRQLFEVYPVLLELVREPGHPAWRAALSRMAELGDGYALEILEGVEVGKGEAARELEQARRALRERVEGLAEQDPGFLIGRSLSQVSWMEVSEHPATAEYLAWIEQQVPVYAKSVKFDLSRMQSLRFNSGKHEDPAYREQVKRMHTRYTELCERFAR